MMNAKIILFLRDTPVPSIVLQTTEEGAKKAFEEWSDSADPVPYITITDTENAVWRFNCVDIIGVVVAEEKATPQVLTPEKPGLVIPDSMKN